MRIPYTIFLYRVKEFFLSLTRYPHIREHKADYDEYWSARKLTKDRINEFQKDRADLALGYIKPGSDVMDIGCGNGALLARVHRTKKLARMVGVDVSNDALVLAHHNGLETIRADVNNVGDREGLPETDYIFLFEVIEHTPHAEELVRWAHHRARKGVFISVPNTGFIGHRLRLLLGRFPLQWRTHPSEHVRFWTLRDMRWWLGQLGHASYHLRAYQGVPLLNRRWPGLFSQGLFVFISR